MNYFQRFAGAALCAGLLLALSGCGAAYPVEKFSQQVSTECTLSCHIELEEIREGLAESVSRDFEAEAAADLTQDTLQLSGTLQENGGDSVEVESYGIQDETAGPVSYYRCGDQYDTLYTENGYLDLITLPRALEGVSLKKQKATAFVNFVECSLYTGSAQSGDSDLLFLDAWVPGTVPLMGAEYDVTLAVYPDARLPARLTLEFTGLEEQPLTYTDSSGELHPITALTVEVTYLNYGRALQIQVPEDFVPEVAEYVPDSADSQGIYTIQNEDGSCSYEIQMPEQMALNNAEFDCVSFYRYHNEVDMESVEYTIFSDYTNEDELQYAAYLPEYYAADEASTVTATEIQSLTIDGYDVQYIAVYSVAELEGTTSQYMLVHSWCPATEDGRDSLEVQIYDYVVSGGEPLDPETELKSAYACILGRAEP